MASRQRHSHLCQPAGRLFQPVIRVAAYGLSDLGSAPLLRSCHFAGSGRRCCVRSAADGASAVPQLHRGAGSAVLPDGWRRAVPVRAAAGRRTVPGVHPAGGSRGQRGVFHAVFRFSASRLGFLAGSERGIFTPAGLACAERLVNLQKNRQADEKPLLFL